MTESLAPMSAFRVHKFGGSSVADAACMRRVAAILRADPHPRLAVVVSACRGVTDALLGLVSAAERQDPSVETGLEALRDPACRHRARLLVSGPARDAYMRQLESDCRDIAGILHDRPADPHGLRRGARSRRRLRRALVEPVCSREHLSQTRGSDARARRLGRRARRDPHRPQPARARDPLGSSRAITRVG